MFKIRTSECRVGVVGLYYSGKTVLLTSLLNHLQAHDPDRFRLGDATASIRKFKELDPDRDWERFNYAAHRARLVRDHRWPAITRDCFQYVCQFERSDWRYCSAKMKFYDLPGERIADVIMAGMDFAEWSDYMIRRLENDTDCRDCCCDFLKTLDCPETDGGTVLQAYRLGLYLLILKFKPFVSPSTFFLDTKGILVKVRSSGGEPLTPHEIVTERYAGLTADSQFAPLPRRWRDAQPELARVFAQRYDAYKTEIVLPWLRALKSCHSLIFLVDVITILENGHPMYNDMQQILSDLLEVLDPGETVLGKTMRGVASLFVPHWWQPSRITRIVFTAPKLDLVYPSEKDKMIGLVRELARRKANDHDGLIAEYTNCSAVVSTRALPNDGNGLYLSGRLNGQEQRFPTPELPLGWENEWPAGKYVFPRVSPVIPPVRECPPQQVNVDKLLNFVMGGWHRASCN